MEYLKWKQYFAQCAGKTERFVAESLKELGAKKCKENYRGVFFEAEEEVLYKIMANVRTVSRILAPFMIFTCHNTKYLYRKIKKFPWENILSEDDSFYIINSSSDSKIKHSLYASQVMKDGIVDRLREIRNIRPDVSSVNPDKTFYIRIRNNKVVAGIDLVGRSLHKRGYRKESTEAPVIETLAAQIAEIVDWKGENELYDPMCGSGTLLAEAYMRAADIPVIKKNEMPTAVFLPGFDKYKWKRFITEAWEKSDDKNLVISGSDISGKAVRAAETNLRELAPNFNWNLKQMSYEDIKDLSNRTIIVNPPYGVRLQDKEEVKRLYGKFGDFLKQCCKGSAVWILTGDKSMSSCFGLRPSKKIPLVNGSLDSRLLKFEIY